VTSRPRARRRQAPPRLSGGLPLLGHLLELRRAPIELFWRVRNECGEIGEMNWAGNRVVLLTGEAAQEAFFRAEEEQLDQAAAYPFMTPIFGAAWCSTARPSSAARRCATSRCATR
jgi:sterol 14-demethylase